ncbi:MAG: hypothetical protein AAGF19_03250 [Pseudomonadota bacterium]
MPRLKILPALALIAIALLSLRGAASLFTADDPFTAIQPAYAAGEGDKKKSKKDKDTEKVSIEEPAEIPRPARPPMSSSIVSPAELEVLESLGDRRKEIEARIKEIDMKQSLLTATEKRVEARIAELKDIETEIQNLLGQREAAEEEQIARLVKVYESMKAKDAARIFDKLDRSILINVASRMKESKIAAVMSKMDAASAQELTAMLANRLDLLAAQDPAMDLIP